MWTDFYSIHKTFHKLLSNSVDPDQTAPKEQSDQGVDCLPRYLFFQATHLMQGHVILERLRDVRGAATPQSERSWNVSVQEIFAIILTEFIKITLFPF